MKSAAAAINGFDQDRIAELESKGSITLDLDGEPLEILLGETDISAEDVPGLSVASEGGLTVALDIALDDELLKEGMARELVSRIQTLRKESGLEVTDRIELHIQRNGGRPFEQAVKAHASHILTETLSVTPEDQLLVGELSPAFGKPVEVELEGAGKCLLALAKAAVGGV
jgi:isoleucyl-tRNA synthetase